ncbi:MAG: HU family DNA-binding protein [Acidobacteria bacterium]|nr:HU family DNA-binding protein [Acidobacteriota bacterium]
MNKGDLIDRVSSDAGISKAQADRAIDSVLRGITDSLRKGERVTLVGFGTFGVSQRKARRGVNPQTNEAMKIPATKGVRFSAGKKLKEVVNKRKRS